MKRSQIILISVFIVITGLIYMALSKNKKEYNKELKTEDTITYVPVRDVKNKLRMLTLTSYGQIMPYSEVLVSVEIQGKLEKGELSMKPGTNFRKGQVLYHVNNEEAFYALKARKSAFMNLLINVLPDIELDFPDHINKWTKFVDEIKLNERLPEFPLMTGKERLFMTSRTIISEYYNVMSQEARLDKYFYIAPFNGTVIETYAEPGAIANPGGQLAKIAKTGDFEVKVPISMEDLKLFKNESTVNFSDASGKIVANGKIIRVSDVINKQTQSADVYYSVSPLKDENIYNGMYVNVSILNKKYEKKTMTLPVSAVKNNKVNILDGDKVKQQQVLIISSIPDSVFVTGLKDGQKVLLERVDKIDPKMIYKGVKR